MTMPMPPSSPPTSRRLTFSFDSSGWLYLYHLGVAKYLQNHVLPRLPADNVAFSGSSGGALVAAALCLGVNIDELTHFIVSCAPECRFNPWKMLPCCDEAIAAFLPPDAHTASRGRLRVLLTRVGLNWMRPLIRPEAASSFGSYDELAQTLRASCHIPLLGGLRPYGVTHPDGTVTRFYDGLFWPSLLYTWRAFERSDAILKVSGIGWPTAHIGLSIAPPPHWTVMPPSDATLRRLYAAGYDDAARFFESRAARDLVSRGGGLPPRLPSSSELPETPQPRRPALVCLIILGWAHLLLLTCASPLVPPYLAIREMIRPPSPRSPRSAAASTGTSAADLLRRALIIAATLALWPIALAIIVLRALFVRERAPPSPVLQPTYGNGAAAADGRRAASAGSTAGGSGPGAPGSGARAPIGSAEGRRELEDLKKL